MPDGGLPVHFRCDPAIRRIGFIVISVKKQVNRHGPQADSFHDVASGLTDFAISKRTQVGVEDRALPGDFLPEPDCSIIARLEKGESR